MSDMEELGSIFSKVSEGKPLTPEQARVLHEFSDALVSRRLTGIGIDALADFMVLLRAISVLGPLRKWAFRALAALGATLLLWNDAVEVLKKWWAGS